MNFRVALVHKALMSASKVCREGYRIVLDSKLGQSGMLQKNTNEWIGLREKKSCLRFRQLDFSGNDSCRKRSEVVNFDAIHNVDMTPMDFPKQEKHP